MHLLLKSLGRDSPIQRGYEIHPIRIWKHLKSRLFEGRISNGWTLAMATVIVPTIQKPDHSNLDVFVQISNGFWPNGGLLSRFQIRGHLDFSSHLKSGPFACQTLFDHSKSRRIWISDPDCTYFVFYG